uniref:Phospholipase n=1 Tax=Panagrolaimus superbus TaxID=310955 RepID=A0A914Z7J7_9BILA
MATTTTIGNDGTIVPVEDIQPYQCNCFDDDKNRSPRRRRGYIPYSSIYESQDTFRDSGYWIPGIPIDAKISKVEKDTSSSLHLTSPYVYTIDLEHGKFVWQVQKRYQDFSYLSNRLLAHRAVERIKAPVRRTHRHLEQTVNSLYGREHKDGCPYKYSRDDVDNARGSFCEDSTSEVYQMSPDIEFKEMSLADAAKQEIVTLPPRRESEDNEDQANPIDLNVTHKSGHLPHFPMVPDSMIDDVQIVDRKQRLEHWLKAVLEIAVNRNYHETAEFLEISRYSFINEIGGKHREGKVKKRPGGGRVYVGMKQCCFRYFLPWGKRWLIIKDTYCCYMNPSTEQIRQVLLIDEHFEINPKDMDDIKKREFVIANSQHVLHLKCKYEIQAELWQKKLESVCLTTGQIWLQQKRFGASFPERENALCEWFVDARAYYEKAASFMEMAREEIFIADWWLSPEIYMKRPMAEANKWRLDVLLKRIAERGVRIFVLLYKEVEMALGLNSMYTKRTLQGLHPNIKVMRHPDHYVTQGTFMWAHHEKLVIIDQLIAFVGGVDLCYGRWDDQRHVLTDLGSIQLTPRPDEEFTMTNGLVQAVGAATSSLVNDARDNNKHQKIEKKAEENGSHEVVKQNINDKVDVINDEVVVLKEEDEDKPPKTSGGSRMKQKFGKVLKMKKLQSDGKEKTAAAEPFEDVKLDEEQQKSISATPEPGTPSTPVGAAHNAIKIWQRKKRPEPIDESFSRERIIRDTLNSSNHKLPKGTARVNISAVKNPKSTAAARPSSSNPLKATESRNSNVLRKVIANLKTTRAKKRWRYALETDDMNEEYMVNYYRQQNEKVDMSGLEGAGKLWPGKDYVNYIHKDFVDVEDPFSDFTDRYQVPRMPWHDLHALTFGEVARDVARHFIQRWNATKNEKLKNNTDYPFLIPKSYDWTNVPKVFQSENTYTGNVQILRSVSNWSALIDKNEASIQQAYLSLIANSKHYVYIENQFFVSMINSNDVSNEICRVICDRIIKADRNGESFRLYIMVPLLPGFEGDIKNSQYSALLAVLHYTYLSISRGPHSLLECLKQAGVEDPWKYISITGLRTHDELVGKLVTELIYVHCKLMIVDDLHTIIGSANINDRSQVGYRDSEVCLLMTDTEFVSGIMNGKPYKAGKFASSLRKRLMKEHLGLLEGVLHPAEPEYEINVDDPVADSFFVDVWGKIAVDNTKIYEEVFRVIPTDMVETFDELRSWAKELPMSSYNPELAKQKLKHIIGNLVQFPTNFLLKENLSPQLTSKEGLVPSALFT